MSARTSSAPLTLLCLAAGVTLMSCTAEVSEPKAADPRVEQFAKLPDWHGIWAFEGVNPGISGFEDLVKGGTTSPLVGADAPWNEAGRAKFEKIFVAASTRKSNGWGFPMMMSSLAPLQFVITPEETLIVNLYSEVRHIYTDGRDHPKAEDRWLTTWGDSVGHWEGDTLVIDTVSVRDPNLYFQIAPLLSGEAHYVERLRLTAPGRIESQMTIEDPQTLTKPWIVKLTYLKTPELDRLIHDDFTNDRSEVENDAFAIEPPKK